MDTNLSQRCKLFITKGSLSEGTVYRSSRLHMFFKIGVLKKFVNYTEKRLLWSIFLKKLETRRPSTLRSSRPEVFCEKGVEARNFIQKRLQHRCFHVNIVKLLRTTLFIKHLQYLILNSIKKKLRHMYFPL